MATQRENEFDFYMAAPSCNNEKCFKIGLIMPITCKCRVTHYCSIECKETDKSHTDFCEAFCKDGDLTKISSKSTGLLYNRKEVVSVQFEGYLRGKVAWGRIVFPRHKIDGAPKMYVGQLDVVKYMGKPILVVRGVGKSLKCNDPREKIKSNLHIGTYDGSFVFEHGPGVMHGNNGQVMRSIFESGHAEMSYSANHVHINTDRHVPYGKNRPIIEGGHASTDQLLERSKRSKNMIICRIGKERDQTFQVKPKKQLSQYDNIRIVRPESRCNVPTGVELEFIVSNSGEYVDIIPCIMHNNERSLARNMNTGENAIGEILEKYYDMESSGSSDSVLGDISDDSSEEYDYDHFEPVYVRKESSYEPVHIRKEKRRHKSEDEPKISTSKKLYSVKEVSKRDMSVKIDKEISVKDALIKNKWVLCRQKKHLVYKRTVLLCGNDVPQTQSFTMPSTSSDRKGHLASIKVLHNCNRSVSKVY